MYTESFVQLINRCRSQYHFNGDFIIGSGNPDSRILFVGKEPTGDAKKTNTLEHYEQRIQEGKTDNWTRVKNVETKEQGSEPSYWRCNQTLWARYQALIDYVFPDRISNRKEIFDFEEVVFCSEMNGSPSKRTKDANKDRIQERKLFFKDPFFDRFSVILLACGNYINNISNNPEEREIDSIFGVRFERECGTGKNRFWVHKNTDESRLVIHTRNLSNGIPNDMLEDMAKIIRPFLGK